jgi:GMP synthase-like glutamine amidotransferase
VRKLRQRKLRTFRIALLVADYVNDDFLCRHGDLPQMFESFFRNCISSCRWQIEVFNVYEGQFPESTTLDGLIVTGSRCSVNDALPWILQLDAYLKLCIEDGVPSIGFCFGHQMLAKAIGGRVHRRPCGPNVGLLPVRLQSDLDWLPKTATPTSELIGLFNHSEEVAELPQGAILLAGDCTCQVQAFKYKNIVLGFQFHPEYTIDYQNDLMEVNTSLTAIGKADARARNATLVRTDKQVALWVQQFIIFSSSKGGRHVQSAHL